MTDLLSIAEDLWDEILDGCQPNTSEIIEQYELTEQQVQKVKKLVRVMSAEYGVIWGWYPPDGRFILAPHNQPEVARVMLRYVLDHWKEAGANAHLTFTAGHRQGYVGENMSNSIDVLRSAFDREIDTILEKLGYRAPKDSSVS